MTRLRSKCGSYCGLARRRLCEGGWRFILRVLRKTVWMLDDWIYRQEQKLRQETGKQEYLAAVDPAASALREWQFTSHQSPVTDHERGNDESDNREHRQNHHHRGGTSGADLGGHDGLWAAFPGIHHASRTRRSRQHGQVRGRDERHEEARSGRGEISRPSGVLTRKPKRRKSAADFDRMILERRSA
jgi:hypothetical protein